MANINDAASMGALLHKVYDGKLHQLFPDQFDGVKNFAVKQGGTSNEDFNITVHIKLPQNRVFKSPGDGVSTLPSSYSGQSRQAKVKGFGVYSMDTLGFELLDKAAKKGEGAVAKATAPVMTGLVVSHRHIEECNLWHGGVELGVVASATGNVVTLTQDSWAAGIWSNSVGAPLDFHSAASTPHVADVTIDTLDTDNRAITLSDATGVGPGDFIYFADQYGKTALGVDAIVTEATELFSVPTQHFWQGSIYDAGGAAFSQSVVNKATAKLLDKGFSGGEVTLWVNNVVFDRLEEEQRSQIYLTGGQVSGENKTGFSGIKIVKGNITVHVRSHNYIKQGQAFLLVMKYWCRLVGPDVSLGGPEGGNPLVEIPDGDGYYVKARSISAPFNERPAYNVKITNFTW